MLQRLRVGIPDVTAAAVVILVLALELVGRDKAVQPLYLYDEPGGGGPVHDDSLAADIGRLEARLAVAPGDGEAAELLATRLAKADQTDWALRAIGPLVESPEPRPERWRAMLALSSIHAERIDIVSAERYAQQAFRACDDERNRAAAEGKMAGTSACPDYERVRLQAYVNELVVGRDIMQREGIDPALDPFEFRRKVDAANPRARLRGPTPR